MALFCGDNGCHQSFRFFRVVFGQFRVHVIPPPSWRHFWDSVLRTPCWTLNAHPASFPPKDSVISVTQELNPLRTPVLQINRDAALA